VRNPWTSNVFKVQQKPLDPKRARGGLARYWFLGTWPLVLIPLIILAVVLYRQAQADLTGQITAHFISLASLKGNQIEEWAAARTADMTNLSQAPDIFEPAQVLTLDAATNADIAAARRTLSERFNNYLSANPDYQALLLARPDTGAISFATVGYEHLLGAMPTDEAFVQAAKGGVFLAPLQYNPNLDAKNLSIIIAAPILTEPDGVVALLVGLVQPEHLLTITTPGLGLGTSGRSYLISSDGYELGTPINPQAPKPQSFGIQHALVNHELGMAFYPNLTGQQVVGAYQWLPNLNVALLIEENFEEAYAPLQRLLLTLGLVGGAAALLSLLFILFLTYRVTHPLQELTDYASRLAVGDLSGVVRIERQDEIGLLAQAFDRMVTEFRELYTSLEKKVEGRTQHLAIAAEVGRAATSILSTERLLARTVELIRDRFGYYHASVFLLDETGEYAFLRESTGDAGAKLKARGHRLAVGSNSLIGWVTANRRPRIASEVKEDPIHFKNELLPDTRSEAAFPLRLGNRIIGALDVQSREPNAFTPTDVEVLQILADQIAVAVENGRLFGRQQRIAKLEQLIASLTTTIHRSFTVETILENTAKELGRELGAQKVVVRLHPSLDGEELQQLAEAVPGNGKGLETTKDQGLRTND
jgi:HAMP domain-containing protein